MGGGWLHFPIVRRFQTNTSGLKVRVSFESEEQANEHAKKIRELNEKELKFLVYSAKGYVELKNTYMD